MQTHVVVLQAACARHDPIMTEPHARRPSPRKMQDEQNQHESASAVASGRKGELLTKVIADFSVREAIGLVGDRGSRGQV